MPPSPAANAPIVDAVLGRFARACPDAVGLPARRPGVNAIARVWLLGDAYVLRAREATPGAAGRFEREQALVDRVRPLLPWRFPTPLPADDGRRYVAADGALWTLHRAIPGRVRCPWQGLATAEEPVRRSLVATLRAMHDATRGRLAPPEPRWLADDVRRRLAAVANRLSSRARSAVTDALGRTAARAARLATADATFVHGDFHWGNVLVGDDGQVTGIVDLDWCRVADPVEDLAYTAMMLTRRDDGGAPDPAALEAVLAGYGLPADRRDAFDDAFLLYVLFDVDLFARADGLDDRDRHLARQVALLEAVCRRP